MTSIIQKMADNISAQLKKEEEAQQQAAQKAPAGQKVPMFGQVINMQGRKERFCLQEKIYRGIPHIPAHPVNTRW